MVAPRFHTLTEDEWDLLQDRLEDIEKLQGVVRRWPTCTECGRRVNRRNHRHHRQFLVETVIDAG